MEDPLCDIIIGNIPEVVKQPNNLLYSGNKIDTQFGRVSLPQQKAPYRPMTNVNLSQEQSCSTKGAISIHSTGSAKYTPVSPLYQEETNVCMCP